MGTDPTPLNERGCSNCGWLRQEDGLALARCGKTGISVKTMMIFGDNPACGPEKFQGWKPHPLTDAQPHIIARMFGKG